jgi:hypothetical protein
MISTARQTEQVDNALHTDDPPIIPVARPPPKLTMPPNGLEVAPAGPEIEHAHEQWPPQAGDRER